MDTRVVLFAVAVMVGLAAGFVIATAGGSSIAPAEAGRLVVDWLAANDLNVTLLGVSEESGLYRVAVKDATDVASEFYVSRDGRLLFQPGVAGINQSISRLVSRRAFFDCLAAKGLIFFGSTETNSTLLQLQILGGSSFVDRIYVSCEGEQAQSCIDAGIEEVPTFVYANQSYSGVKTLDWFSNLTNCTMA